VESQTRYQMILLAQQGFKVPQIARIVLRSEDTVERVLKRFLAGGLDAVPRCTPPGRERRVTAAWEGELLRVIELDPHAVGVSSANWTTELLAEYLGQQTGIQVKEETVRVLACEWVRLQTTHVDLTTQSGRAGGLRGKRERVEVLLAGVTALNLYPLNPCRS
jgi:transposase